MLWTFCQIVLLSRLLPLWMAVLPYGQKFWREIYFGRLATLRAIRQYFIQQNFTVWCHCFWVGNHSFHVCNRPAARSGSLTVSMEYTSDSCVWGHHVSKEIWALDVGKSWLVNVRRQSNDVFVVTVKTTAGIAVSQLLRKILAACSQLLCQNFSICHNWAETSYQAI